MQFVRFFAFAKNELSLFSRDLFRDRGDLSEQGIGESFEQIESG
jgi:hypothetical protein